jgi:fatty acid desaturase
MTTDHQPAPEHDGGALPLCVLFPLGALCLGIFAQPWATQSVRVYLPLLAVTSLVFLCCTSCFHETAHQTLSNSTWLSVIVGRCLGTLMFTPYLTYRKSHIRRHIYLNKPTNFELWPCSNPNVSL